MKKILLTAFLFISTLGFSQISEASMGTILYQGNGHIFTYGVNGIKESQIESILTDYQAKTGIEIGVVLTDDYKDHYRGTYENFVNNFLPNAGFNPNGFLLGIDTGNRKTHLRVNTIVEFGEGGWKKSDTNKVIFDYIIPNMKEGNTNGALLEAIGYITNKMNKDINVLKTEAIESQKTAEIAKAQLKNNLIKIAVALMGVLLAIYVTSILIRKHKIKVKTEEIKDFFNKTFPVLTGDLKGSKEELAGNITEDTTELFQKFDSRLDDVKTRVLNFFEDDNKTLEEAEYLFSITEELTSELQEFLNNSEKINSDNKKSLMRELKDRNKFKKELIDESKKLEEQIAKIDL